jgi:hypothetical protein
MLHGAHEHKEILHEDSPSKGNQTFFTKLLIEFVRCLHQRLVRLKKRPPTGMTVISGLIYTVDLVITDS